MAGLTRHRPPLPRRAVPDREEYLRRWSALHEGVRPAGLVGGWLRVTHALARPVARLGVPPDVVTLAGLGLAGLATVPAAGGGRWPLAAVAVVVAAALLDGLDGAVAILTGRVTRWGHVLDSVCDRLADAAFAAALWLAGAPPALAVAGGAVGWLHEYLRARATAGGMSDVGIITVSERPTRVIVTAMFLLGAGLFPADAAGWATAGASALTTIGAVGLAQLVRVVRRRLRRPPA